MILIEDISIFSGVNMAVKGMKDYLPAYQSKLEYLISEIKAVYESYGFLPMDSPALEDLEILYKKSGEEIKKQIFKVESKYGMRFDLTVPLARIISENNFPRPFKRYSIGKVWRLEEPQKGRYREFYQADIDMIGVKGVEAEAELLSCVSRILKKFNLEYKILVNDRRILNILLEKYNFSDKENAMRILDKIEKIGIAEVKKELERLGNAESLLNFITDHNIKDENSVFEKIKDLSNDVYQDLKKLKELCSYYDVSFEIDFSLVRGLAYYTSTVFEIKAKNFNFSIAGGGRYDNLLGIYGKNDFAVGISIGLERLLLLLNEMNFNFSQKTKIYIISDDKTYHECIKIANKLRDLHIVELDLMNRKMDKQLEYAVKQKFDYAIIYCEKEKKEEKVKIKNLKNKMQKEIDYKTFLDSLNRNEFVNLFNKFLNL